MTTFTTRAACHIGIIEVAGPLNTATVVDLRQAFAEATTKAQSRHVVIVADKITSMDDSATLVMIAECTALRAQGGNAAWVSTSGRLPTHETAASTNLFMDVYPTVEHALELLHIRTAGIP
jgi:anti-anti-sigma factor